MPCALQAETGGRGRSLENKIFPGENCCYQAMRPGLKSAMFGWQSD